MIFNNTDKFKVTRYPFNWGVDYSDGSFTTEFNDDGIQNDYYEIELEKIIRFGMFNEQFKMFYQNDGSFSLAGQLIEIEYHTNEGDVYNLTSSFSKKDCITYKQAYTDPVSRGVQKTNLEAICFGYKTIVEKDNTQFYFKPIVTAPLIGDGKVYITVQLTSNRDLKGKLVFKNKYKVVEEFDANLRRNYSGIINWTVK